jgi:hypothetical protein
VLRSISIESCFEFDSLKKRAGAFDPKPRGELTNNIASAIGLPRFNALTCYAPLRNWSTITAHASLNEKTRSDRSEVADLQNKRNQGTVFIIIGGVQAPKEKERLCGECSFTSTEPMSHLTFASRRLWFMVFTLHAELVSSIPVLTRA